MTDLLKEHPPRIKRTKIDGVAVQKDEPLLSPGLSKVHGRSVPLPGQRKLTLEDGTVRYGCNDCAFIGEQFELHEHRKSEHPPARTAARVAKQRQASDEPARLPEEIGSMTLQEIHDLAANANQWGQILANAEQRLADKDAQLAEEKAAHAETKRVLRNLERRVGSLAAAVGGKG